MNTDLNALSADLRRASYFFQANDSEMAQKFVDRGLKNYVIPDHIKEYLQKIVVDGKHAAERAMTASIILAR